MNRFSFMISLLSWIAIMKWGVTLSGAMNAIEFAFALLAPVAICVVIFFGFQELSSKWK